MAGPSKWGSETRALLWRARRANASMGRFGFEPRKTLLLRRRRLDLRRAHVALHHLATHRWRVDEIDKPDERPGPPAVGPADPDRAGGYGGDDAEKADQERRRGPTHEQRFAPRRPHTDRAVLRQHRAVRAAIETHAHTAFGLLDQGLSLGPGHVREVVTVFLAVTAEAGAVVAGHVVPRGMARRGNVNLIERNGLSSHASTLAS